MKINNVNVNVISTGSANINKLLRGGIKSQTITQVYDVDEFMVDRMRICKNLYVMAQMPLEFNVGGGKVFYIETLCPL
jgi:hypothetical protein